MSKHLCFVHTKAEKLIDDVRTKVCRSLPPNLHSDGNHYCLLHFPADNKNTKEFQQIVEDRKNESSNIKYDFRFVWFPSDLNFHDCEFDKDVSFCYATFSGNAEFGIAKFFQSAQFKNAVFQKGVSFADAIFYDGGYFSNATFTTSAWFSKSTFYSDANFNGATFLENCYATFRDAVFYEGLDFGYLNSEANIEFANLERDEMFLDIKTANEEIDKLPNKLRSTKWKTRDERDKLYQKEPTLSVSKSNISNTEKIIFQNVRLEPSWFVDVDSRKFTFNACRFEYINASEIKLQQELSSKNLEHYKNKESVLKITYRHLAENAENNNRFEEASKFRQMAFECERLERKERISVWWRDKVNCFGGFIGSLPKQLKSLPYDFVHWLYRWTSGYGENRLWAFFVLFLIIFSSSILYSTSLCEFPNGQNSVRSLDFIESIAYSLRVMVLQRPEPFPINTFGKVVLAFESVLAPLQLALLALAIRRKFMR